MGSIGDGECGDPCKKFSLLLKLPYLRGQYLIGQDAVPS